MLRRIDISGVHTDVNDDLRKYVMKKIGRLDRYVNRHGRKSVHVEVKLKENKAKNKKQCTCEVIMHLPHETLTTKESTLNMYAAIDIVEEKLKNQLKKYKDIHASPRSVRHLWARIRRKQGRRL